jgi:hypothetical protein
MRRCRLTLPVALFVLLLLSGTASNGAPGAFERRWERTPDGWRRVVAIEARPRFDSAGLHPLVVAAGQLTLSLFALAAFPARVAAAGKPTGDRV